jgi:hypothetical protein
MNKLEKTAIFLAAVTVVILSVFAWSPWLTEEYGKEKVLDYFSQKYNFDKNNIMITSIEKKPFEMHFGLSFSQPKDAAPLNYGSSVHAWINFYGEVKHDQFTASH